MQTNGIPAWKRALDVAFVVFLSPVLLPLFALISFWIKQVSPGPILFRQVRVGYRGNHFTCLKFRSMKAGAEERVHRNHIRELMHSEKPMTKLDARGDARLIPLGALLRSTGLDELPQFINVCRGEMSVIGPRPLTAEDVRRLGWADRSHEWRFAARPGVTGLSQLLAGRSARYSRRLERLYLSRQSFSFDLRLIALSFAVNLVGKRTVRHWLSHTTARSN